MDNNENVTLTGDFRFLQKLVRRANSWSFFTFMKVVPETRSMFNRATVRVSRRKLMTTSECFRCPPLICYQQYPCYANLESMYYYLLGLILSFQFYSRISTGMDSWTVTLSLIPGISILVTATARIFTGTARVNEQVECVISLELNIDHLHVFNSCPSAFLVCAWDVR